METKAITEIKFNSVNATRTYRNRDLIDVSKIWCSYKVWRHVLGINNINCYCGCGSQHLMLPLVLSTSILWQQQGKSKVHTHTHTPRRLHLEKCSRLKSCVETGVVIGGPTPTQGHNRDKVTQQTKWLTTVCSKLSALESTGNNHTHGQPAKGNCQRRHQNAPEMKFIRFTGNHEGVTTTQRHTGYKGTGMKPAGRNHFDQKHQTRFNPWPTKKAQFDPLSGPEHLFECK